MSIVSAGPNERAGSDPVHAQRRRRWDALSRAWHKRIGRWFVRVATALAVLTLLASTANAFIPLGEHVTLVPLPEVIVDPNEGETVGVMTSVLFSDEHQELRRILAPDVRYNDITGVFPTLRLYEYPTRRQKLLLEAGKATKIGEHFEALYSGEDLFDGRIDAQARLFHENDPFERFSGFGNNTPSSAETNYTGDAGIVFAYVALHLPHDLRIGTQTRLKVERVREGGIHTITQLLQSNLATTPGASGATMVGQAFNLRYDTRDDTAITTTGLLGDAAVEVVDRALGSSASYIRYSIEGRSFLPLTLNKDIIFASQMVLSYLEGGDRAPFYDRNSLGGVRSLRGFGSNRYVDNHRCFLRSELRMNVWQPDWLTERFRVHGHLEAAPFFEIGRVFNSSRTFPLADPHVDGGLGLRAVIPPQLVTYVDIATTGFTATVFTGVDYPF